MNKLDGWTLLTISGQNFLEYAGQENKKNRRKELNTQQLHWMDGAVSIDIRNTKEMLLHEWHSHIYLRGCNKKMTRKTFSAPFSSITIPL